MPFSGFFSGKRVLVTGHTGFKGSWLSAWLARLGSYVVGYAHAPKSDRDHYRFVRERHIFDDEFFGDIRDQAKLTSFVHRVRPDVIFHLAAQALVSKSYSDPAETWSTNVIGTQNLLECLRFLEHACRVVIVTSDKCYENKEWVWGYRETDELGGSDPYSSSKAAVELLVSSYLRSFLSEGKVCLGVGRAGNVIGGGDWSTDRLMPDLVRGLETEGIVHLRSPMSTRPWQHVLEPLSGYLCLAERLPALYSNKPLDLNLAFNFGPDGAESITVGAVVDKVQETFGKRLTILRSDDAFKESRLLKLSSEKAHAHLGWKTTLSSAESVKLTAEWYHHFMQNPSRAFEFTDGQISLYEDLATARSIGWTA